MAKLTNVYCTYTGGGIYVCTAKYADVWFVTDFEMYGTYDVPYDDIEEKYDYDYDSHTKDPSVPLPTWADVLEAIMDSYKNGKSDNMDPYEVERSIRYLHPDLSLRVDQEDKPVEESDNSERLETIASFIEVFEDFLEEKGVEIPNPEKEEAVRDGEDPDSIAPIYGTDYGNLSDRIEDLLVRYGVLN